MQPDVTAIVSDLTRKVLPGWRWFVDRPWHLFEVPGELVEPAVLVALAARSEVTDVGVVLRSTPHVGIYIRCRIEPRTSQAETPRVDAQRCEICERPQGRGDGECQLSTIDEDCGYDGITATRDVQRYYGEYWACQRAAQNWRGSCVAAERTLTTVIAYAAMVMRAKDVLAEYAENLLFILDNHICDRCKRSYQTCDVEEIDKLRAIGKTTRP